MTLFYSLTPSLETTVCSFFEARCYEGTSTVRQNNSKHTLPPEQNNCLEKKTISNCRPVPVVVQVVTCSAALSDRKVAGSIPTIDDFHTFGPLKKAVFACLATDVKQDTFEIPIFEEATVLFSFFDLIIAAVIAKGHTAFSSRSPPNFVDSGQ